MPRPAPLEEGDDLSQTANQIVAEGERLIAAGIQYGDHTLIFNRHVTPEDAEASVEPVEPDSLVFLEGFARNGNATNLQGALAQLSGIRATYSKHSPEYQQFKQQVISFCANGMDDEPDVQSDFRRHKYVQIGLLLDKDCVIQFADYRRTDQADDEEATIRAHDMFLSYIGSDDKHEWWEGLENNRSIGRTILKLNAEVANKLRFHTLREIHAVNDTLMTTGYLAENPQSLELAVQADGRIKSYLLFGTAHVKSLTQQFVNNRAYPKVRVVGQGELKEYRYIDPVSTMSEWQKQNGRRRIAHDVVSLLVGHYGDGEINEDLIAEAYEPLSYLNEANHEEWQKFLTTAIVVVRDASREDPQAYSRYLSLLRSFMPNPQRFV